MFESVFELVKCSGSGGGLGMIVVGIVGGLIVFVGVGVV